MSRTREQEIHNGFSRLVVALPDFDSDVSRALAHLLGDRLAVAHNAVSDVVLEVFSPAIRRRVKALVGEMETAREAAQAGAVTEGRLPRRSGIVGGVGDVLLD